MAKNPKSIKNKNIQNNAYSALPLRRPYIPKFIFDYTMAVIVYASLEIQIVARQWNRDSLHLDPKLREAGEDYIHKLWAHIIPAHEPEFGWPKPEKKD